MARLSDHDTDSAASNQQSGDQGVVGAVTETAQDAVKFVARMGNAFTSGVRDARDAHEAREAREEN